MTVAKTIRVELGERSYPIRIKQFSVAADPATQPFPITFTMPQPTDLNVLPGMNALVIIYDFQLGEA